MLFVVPPSQTTFPFFPYNCPSFRVRLSVSTCPFPRDPDHVPTWYQPPYQHHTKGTIGSSHTQAAMEKKPKIYFAASIRGGRDDVELYRELIDYMQTFGKVLTEHIGLGLKPSGENDKDDKFIHDRDMAWLDESDVLIAEVTQPSLGVGYEIGRAIERGKTILCLFRPDSGRVLSAMIRGAEGENLQAKDYQGIDEAKRIIRGFLATKNLIR